MKLERLETRFVDNPHYAAFRAQIKDSDKTGDSASLEQRVSEALDQSCDMLDDSCEFWFGELPDIGLLDRDGGRRKESQYDVFMTELAERRRQLRASLPGSISMILDFEETVLSEECAVADKCETWGDRLNGKICSAMNCLEGYIYWLTLVHQDLALLREEGVHELS